MYNIDFDAASKLARQGTLIPVYREILADLETPVGVLQKFADKSHLFLLESVEGGEKWARYSFIGFDPREIIRVNRDGVSITATEGNATFSQKGNPLTIMKDHLSRYQPVPTAGLPPFFGGAVGFFSYEMAAYFDRGIRLPDYGSQQEEAIFYVTDTLLIFDRIRHTLKIVAGAYCGNNADLKAEYRRCTEKIEAIVATINAPPPKLEVTAKSSIHLAPTVTREEYTDRVRRAKDYIQAGEVIQAVISQKFRGTTDLSPVVLYRALRFVNPSPYLFFFKDGNLSLIGSSPETMVRLTETEVELRPIAGTRPRGRDEKEDRKNADELLNDEKERAEHVMLVDLGRNDLGRVSRIGSVQVNQLMLVERYSHVMHLVSHIRSQLAEGKDAFAVLAATFPAGTLSGAPKIRAMEIISELEKEPRGAYGGAIGYFSFNGNMDFGIIIRTIVLEGKDISIQAGAGIVADSDPEHEYAETVNKAKGMVRALNLAASGLDLTEFQGV